MGLHGLLGWGWGTFAGGGVEGGGAARSIPAGGRARAGRKTPAAPSHAPPHAPEPALRSERITLLSLARERQGEEQPNPKLPASPLPRPARPHEHTGRVDQLVAADCESIRYEAY